MKPATTDQESQFTSGLGKFQYATNLPKFKSGRFVTNFGGFNSAGQAGCAGWH